MNKPLAQIDHLIAICIVAAHTHIYGNTHLQHERTAAHTSSTDMQETERERKRPALFHVETPALWVVYTTNTHSSLK